MSLIFGTTSMSTASIMFERKIGSFERAILSPVTMWCVALGKVLGGVIFGLLVSCFMIPVAVLFFKASLINPGVLVLAVLLSSFLFSSFGVFLSLIVKEEVDAMTLANAVRLPMIFISGVFIPIVPFPTGLQVVACCFPLTYSVEILRYGLLDSVDLIPRSLPLGLCLWEVPSSFGPPALHWRREEKIHKEKMKRNKKR